jgi:O-antigen ligase
MKPEHTAKNIARWVALISLFLIPLMPLLVADTFFFPFITGKAFFFRIMAEIAVSAWVVLAFLDKEYRPRFSWIGVAVIAFTAWMFIADLFAVNPLKAFWSNFERMEGWVLLIHLLGLFFAMSGVLRAEKKWRAWFLTSLSVSAVICAYALAQLLPIIPSTNGFILEWTRLPIHQGSTRIDASLGNSAYLAIYFLFNVCIASWLAVTEKNAWLKYALLTLAVVEGVLIFFTETRGTIIGLTIALAVAAALTLFTAGKRARSFAVGALVLIVLLVGGIYAARNTSFVQHNSVLQRITSISLRDGTTRFTLWHMAFEGVAERPIVGWGQEGFNYIFNKYYDPSLYNQEQWFDRAHNAFIDWLTAGGVPAFLLYIALFASALMFLWRSSGLSRPERIALTAALVGYAVHNLFVFDNLYSYVYFFAILALIDSSVARPIALLETAPALPEGDGVTYALPVAGVVAFAIVWMVNVPGMSVATDLISAIRPITAGISSSMTEAQVRQAVDANFAANMKVFKDLAVNPGFAAQEVREQLVNFGTSVVQGSEATDDEKRQAITLAVEEMQKQIASYPLDAREHLQLSYAYRVGGDLPDAMKEVQAALALSPKKEQIWIQAGALAWEQGDNKAAQKYFTTAYELGPQFPDLAAYAAAGDIAMGDTKTANEIILKTFGTTTVDNDTLAVAYYRAKDWPHLIGIWKLRAEAPGASVQTWFGLAAAYYASGDSASAIQTLRDVAAKHPEAASSVTAAIAQIQAGK